MIKEEAITSLDSFHVIGLKYGACTNSIRDAIFLDDTETPKFINTLFKSVSCEVLTVSTCDRLEFYFFENNFENIADTIFKKLSLRSGVFVKEITTLSYRYSKDAALRHLFRVTAALDSHIIGEPQILGQIKTSHRIAREIGTISSNLNAILQHAYHTAKRIRTETQVGEGPVTLAAAAIRIARDIGGDLSQCEAAVFGIDEATLFLAEQFKIAGLRRLTLIDQGLNRVIPLPLRFGDLVGNYDERVKILIDVDIAIMSANTLGYSLTHEMMELIIKKRQYKPVFIVDVGVPSAVDPAIEQIDEVFLYNLEDLECLAMEGKKKRNTAITASEQIIDEELKCFTTNLKKTNVEPLLRELINSMNQERLKILREKPELDPSQITQLLINRLLHNPISIIQELSAKNEFDQTTELLIRKLLISRNKAEGDTSEL